MGIVHWVAGTSCSVSLLNTSCFILMIRLFSHWVSETVNTGKPGFSTQALIIWPENTIWISKFNVLFLYNFVLKVTNCDMQTYREFILFKSVLQSITIEMNCFTIMQIVKKCNLWNLLLANIECHILFLHNFVRKVYETL